MKILVIGATGTIGSAVVDALSSRHEVVAVSRRSQALPVDITDAASIGSALESAGPFDAVVCAAGAARFKPLDQLSDGDLGFSVQNKLMGQVQVVRESLPRLRDGGVVVVTSGVLATKPVPGSSAITLVNAALEGFVRAAALEAPRGIRVLVVSPPWVSETLQKMGRDPQGGLPAATVAKAYVAAVEGGATGQVIEPSAGR